ncbi:hypothetical protein BJ165DRAFT_1589306 [Panaeolus papilionaceus]|nr:hypothetical protein BJ165DRAFT_1589306 [Panaeolus papilionaceus]
MKVSRALSSFVAISMMFASAHAWMDDDYDGLAAREAFDAFWSRDDAADVQNPSAGQSGPGAMMPDAAGAGGGAMGGAPASGHHKHQGHGHGHGHGHGKAKRAYDVLEEFYARSNILSELTTRELVEELENRLLRRDTPASEPAAAGATTPGADTLAASPDAPPAGGSSGAQPGQNGQEQHHQKKKKHHHHHKKQKQQPQQA